MVSLLFRNLIFTLLQPGLVTGLIPFLLLGNRMENELSDIFQFHHYTGILFFSTGLLVTLSCIIRFAFEGRGTLSPVDPTKHLVVKGFYKYSRNPMYVGVMLILIGESVFFTSGRLWIYSLCIFTASHIFIVLVEEPRLHKDFGDKYLRYCQKVRRWV